MPLAHLFTLAAVMKPVRAAGDFAMVFECPVPLSMTSHSTVPKPPLKLILVQLIFTVLVVVERFLADAVDTRAPRSVAAPTAVRSSLLIFTVITSHSDSNGVIRT